MLNKSIQDLLHSKKRFVLFRKPNEDLIQLFSQDNSKNYDSGFVFTNFNYSQSHIVFPEKSEIFTLDDYKINNKISFPKIKGNQYLISEEVSKKTYIQMIEEAIYQLNDDFTKVVLSRIIPWKNESFNELEHFIQLAKNNPSAFCYLIYIPNTLCWMGASPELLVNYMKNTFTTVALAGTKKKEENWTEKEYEEQQMVTNYIEEIIKKYQLSISKSQTITISISPEIEHLKTTISINGVNYEMANKLLSELHPTPAVCGYPKDKAFELIKKIEKHDRLFYTGFVGLKQNEEMQLYVNLRCASVLEDSVLVYVGGGITKKSNPEKEWEETQRKSKTMIF